MSVFIVETSEFHQDGSRRRINVETWHPDLASFAADLRGGPVTVTQLFARRVGNEMVVGGRRALLLTVAFVHHAYDADLPFIEYEDAPEAGAEDPS